MLNLHSKFCQSFQLFQITWACFPPDLSQFLQSGTAFEKQIFQKFLKYLSLLKEIASQLDIV